MRALHDRSALWRLAAASLCGTALLAFALFIATVPGEPTDPVVKGVALLPFSQTIRLPGERLVEPDEDKLSKLAHTLSLHDRDFRQAGLTGADLRKSDLRGTDFSGADLSGANLGDANLTGAQLNGAIMYAADLNSAHLNGANLDTADLSDAHLSDAHLNGADLSYARNLTQAQLDEACGTDAKLPERLTLKPC